MFSSRSFKICQVVMFQKVVHIYIWLGHVTLNMLGCSYLQQTLSALIIDMNSGNIQRLYRVSK